MKRTKRIDYQELNNFSLWNKKRTQITALKNCASGSFNRQKKNHSVVNDIRIDTATNQIPASKHGRVANISVCKSCSLVGRYEIQYTIKPYATVDENINTELCIYYSRIIKPHNGNKALAICLCLDTSHGFPIVIYTFQVSKFRPLQKYLYRRSCDIRWHFVSITRNTWRKIFPSVWIS
jgi:hypothetical protein